MRDHFLLKNAVPIPDQFNLHVSNKDNTSKLYYVTKTIAAPGDDDDTEGFKEVWSPWDSFFY